MARGAAVAAQSKASFRGGTLAIGCGLVAGGARERQALHVLASRPTYRSPSGPGVALAFAALR